MAESIQRIVGSGGEWLRVGTRNSWILEVNG
jgi:hypothetical protein